MGYMNAINLEVHELAEAGLQAVLTATVEEFGEDIVSQGWVPPTAAQVALRALREGDLVRVASILTPTPHESVHGLQEPCS